MKWVEIFPKDTFKDEEMLISMAILTPLSSFGISLKRRGSHLSLYMGAPEAEIHHITSINDMEARGVDPEEALPGTVKTLKLRRPIIYPLCVEVQPSLIYTQARSLRDFVFGLVGTRVSSSVVRKKTKAYLDRAGSKEHRSAGDILEPVKWKNEQTSFFCTTPAYSCDPEMEEALLSSVNFTNPLLEPNSLIPGRTRDGPSIAASPPKMPGFFGGKVAVLTVTELASILPLPPSMWGVEMTTGTEKTFSNYEGDVPDPASFMKDGVVMDGEMPQPEGWDEGVPDPADYFKKK